MRSGSGLQVTPEREQCLLLVQRGLSIMTQLPCFASTLRKKPLGCELALGVACL